MAALSKECLIAALSQEFLKARNVSKGRISKDLAHHTVVRLGRGSTVNTVFSLPVKVICLRRDSLVGVAIRRNSLLRAAVRRNPLG